MLKVLEQEPQRSDNYFLLMSKYLGTVGKKNCLSTARDHLQIQGQGDTAICYEQLRDEMPCLVAQPALHRYTYKWISKKSRVTSHSWCNAGLYIVIYGHNSYVTKTNHWKVWLSADYTKDYISFKINTLLSCSF